MARPIVALFFLATAAAGVSHAQHSWVVSKKHSPGSLASIQAAVNAASDGDVILVGPGVYADFKIQGKALTILGAGPNASIIELPHPPVSGLPYAAITIQGVAQGRVVISSLGARTVPGYEANYPSVRIEQCQAEIVLDRVSLISAGGQITGNNAGPLLNIKNCRSIFLQRINNPFDPSLHRGRVIIQDTEQVSISQSVFYGKDGKDNHFPNLSPNPDFTAQAGEDALSVKNAWSAPPGQLFMSHCSFEGGHGANLTNGLCSTSYPYLVAYPGRGGSGINCQNVHALSVGNASESFKAGKGGTSSHPNCPIPFSTTPGIDGKSVYGAFISISGNTLVGDSSFSSVTWLPPLPSLAISGNAALGGSFSFDLSSAVGDAAFLLLADDTESILIPGIEGFPLFLSPGAGFVQAFSLGAIGPSGMGSIGFTVPNDPILLGLPLFGQGLAASSAFAHPPQLSSISYFVVGN